MNITRITKENEEYFAHVLNETASVYTPDLLRIGVTDDKGHATGALSAFTDAGVIEITSVYVSEDYRRQGYGKALIDTISALAAEDGFATMSSYFFSSDEVRDFYNDAGFELFDFMELEFIRLGELMRSEKCRKLLMHNDTDDIKQVSSLDKKEMKILTDFISDRNIPLRGCYNPDWSTVRIVDDQVADVYLNDLNNGDIYLVWQYRNEKSLRNSVRHVTALIEMIDMDPVMDSTTRLFFASDNERFHEAVSELTGSSAHINSAGPFVHAIKLL